MPAPTEEDRLRYSEVSLRVWGVWGVGFRVWGVGLVRSSHTGSGGSAKEEAVSCGNSDNL